MPTHQAVWPAELVERRRAAVELDRRLRFAQRMAAADPAHPAAAGLAELRAQGARMPCPHWDLELDDEGATEWVCVACDARIAPTWVPLDDQDASLRRLGHSSTVRARRDQLPGRRSA